MLEVVEPGLLTTVQDAGRPDAVHLGVPIGGACDPWSLAVANALAGNGLGAAALEMSMLGATLRVLEDCHVGVAGADMGGGVPVGTSRWVRAGDVLEFGGAREGSGVRTYLALGGGIDVPEVLGSRSTCLVGRFGGLAGRLLRAGDVVRSARAGPGADRRWPEQERRSSPSVIRVVPGPEGSEGGFARLVAAQWTVSGRGDRQGIRLDGPSLVGYGPATMLSRGVTWGTVQLPPDGQPIVLLADHQTVGGYPVVAVAVSADRRLLGQLAPGDELRFAAVDLAGAQRLLREQADEFEQLSAGLR